MPWFRCAPLLALASTGWLAIASPAGADATAIPDRAPAEHASTALPEDGVWSSMTPIARHRRFLPQGFWDRVRDRFVLFGGYLATGKPFANDVWTLDAQGSAWTELETQGTAPPGERSARVVYDSRRDRMLVVQIGAQVWALSLSGAPTWTTFTADRPLPNPRGSSVYDARRDRIITFGGGSSNETWALDLATMTWGLIAGVGPPDRSGHTAVYDSLGDRMVIYGGEGTGTGDRLPQVWSLSLAETPAWSLIPTQGGPVPYDGHAATFDTTTRQMFVLNASGLWALPLDSGFVWRQIAPLSRGRSFMASGFDEARRLWWVVDGERSGGAYDAWSFDLATGVWNTARGCGVTPITIPSAEYVSTSWSSTYDSRRGAPLLLYNATYHDSTFRLWTFVPGDSIEWCELSARGPAPTSFAGAALYDSLRDRLLYVAGTQVWALDLTSGEWAEVPVSGAPTSSSGHALAMDPIRDRVLLFGGWDGSSSIGELWELLLGATPPLWHRITIPFIGSRTTPGLAYDAITNRIFCWGGVNYAGSAEFHNRTGHVADLDDVTPTWTALPSPDAPGFGPPATQLAFDSRRRRVVLHGTSTATGSPELWTLPADGVSSWTRLEPQGSGPAQIGPYRDSYHSVYDPERDLLVLYSTWTPEYDVGGHLLAWGDLPTPARPTIELIEARRTREIVYLRWRTGYDGIRAFAIERRTDHDGWGDIGTAVLDGSHLFYQDETVAEAERYAYRVRVTLADTVAWSAESWVETSTVPDRLALVAVTSPTRRGIQLELQLPVGDPVRLDVIDVAGRLVSSQSWQPAGAGQERLDWTETRTLPSGVYLVRAAQRGRVAVTRVAIVR